jgi:transcriptional regulator MraZ
MLLGAHEHTLDDKNRLTLPAKLREQLGDQLVVTRGLDGCLAVYSVEAFELLAVRVGTLDSFSAEARTMQRFFFTAGERVEPDKQGRIVIPARLLEETKTGRELTVAGVYDHLEIWDRTVWRQRVDKAEGSAEDVAERLANRS